MTRQATRQIALMALLASCMLIVAVILISGLNVQMGAALGQALPLVAVCCMALAVLFFLEPANGER
jgi:NAD(P)H-hydrate repair Nnr-like enzyme with NAD(P)H-hydrate epimerase domain